MSTGTTLRLARQALVRNRLRSALTLLGVGIGVAVVIVMVAVGTGARQAIEQHVRAAGVNMIAVTAGNYSQGDQDPSSGDVMDAGNLAGGAGLSASTAASGARPVAGDGWAGMAASPRLPGRGAARTLREADVAAIARLVPGVRHAAAGVSDTAVLASPAGRLLGRLHGTDVAYPLMRALTVRAGRFFDEDDVAARAPVIVLSAEAAAAVFGRAASPVGRDLAIRGRSYRVIGVVTRPALLGRGTGLPEAYLPYTAAQDLLGIRHLQNVAISAVSAGEVTRIARDVTRVLRARHALGPSDPDDFTIRTQARDAISGRGVNPLFARAVAGSVVNFDQVTMAEMAVSLERSSRTMTALLASVAGVSLLVGGIGIMNVMLVSVTERTREIGLRMAVGARSRDVLLQFLAEATTLSLAGGLGGIAAGIVASGSVGRLLRWSTSVSPASVVAAAAVAAALGVCFGFYPARQASRLEPIDALRFE